VDHGRGLKDSVFNHHTTIILTWRGSATFLHVPLGALGRAPRALGTFLVARVNAVDAGCTCTVFRSSRCRAGCVLGGLDGCEVRLCDPCARVRPVVSRVCPDPACRCKPE
jgi:hypothetical protein